MTPSEFRAIRETKYVKITVMAEALGISESTVRGYECGISPVPNRIAMLLPRLPGSPCVECGRPTTVEFWDHRCGRHTQLWPETDRVLT